VRAKCQVSGKWSSMWQENNKNGLRSGPTAKRGFHFCAHNNFPLVVFTSQVRLVLQMVGLVQLVVQANRFLLSNQTNAGSLGLRGVGPRFEAGPDRWLAGSQNVAQHMFAAMRMSTISCLIGHEYYLEALTRHLPSKRDHKMAPEAHSQGPDLFDCRIILFCIPSLCCHQ
jgi:hypothetical protein